MPNNLFIVTEEREQISKLGCNFQYGAHVQPKQLEQKITVIRKHLDTFYL